MLTSVALLTLTALGGAPETVLLDFTSQRCGPCVAMTPIVDRLAAAGYPVQKIDIDQNPQLAGRFRVTSIPCFVLLREGQETERVVGATSFARLQQMFETGAAAPNGASSLGHLASDRAEPHRPGRGDGEDLRGPPPAAYPAGRFPSPAAPRSPSPPAPAPQASPTVSARSPAVRRALQATVRIRVEDASGRSVGTGTIIDTHGEEALVLTCGHLFRESQGTGKILVELFTPGARGPVTGQLLAYEANDRDIAVLAIRPGTKVSPVAVAPAGYASRPGDRVFSIGCDRGDNPSVRCSDIRGIDRYLGQPNVEVAGAPVDGRSGGGLFSAEGLLIGVCNGADPADDEGVYAALACIHQQLDQVGLQQVYQRSEALASSTAAPQPAAVPAPVSLPQMPREMPSQPRTSSPPATDLPAETEVICIVRSRQHPQGQELFIVERPSPQFLAQLQREGRLGSPGSPGVAGGPSPNSTPAPRWPESQPVVRAQSN